MTPDAAVIALDHVINQRVNLLANCATDSTRKRAIAKALQLKGHPTSRQSIWRITVSYTHLTLPTIYSV